MAGHVVVVGAGPSGLALALQAHAYGGQLRVVERRTEWLRPSRALIMHPRTLEALRPLGVVDALLERAVVSPVVELHLGRRTVPAELESLGMNGTAFPHPVLLRQADVEAVLRQALESRGVAVELGTELVELQGTTAVLRHGQDRHQTSFDYLVGCDGANSTVRALLGVPWRGRAYRQEIVLADLDLDGMEPDRAHVVAGADGLVFLFPIGERAPWRLLATLRSDRDGPDDTPFGQFGPAVPETVLQQVIHTAGLPARITQVAWSARVRLQHRVAEHFRSGNVFLVGDAAHAHSPAGGQGMNTSIQDALNLGWKLAAATTSGSAGAPREVLLDTYEHERRPVARQVLTLTNALFWGESSTDPVAALLRGRIAPLVAPAAPLLLRRRRLVALGLALLAQFHIQYRSSALSVEIGRPASGTRAGHRLPDATVVCDGRTVRLHEMTAAPGFHVLLERSTPQYPAHASGPVVHVHRMASWPGTGGMVIRPDGYVGLRSTHIEEHQITTWLATATGRPSP